MKKIIGTLTALFILFSLGCGGGTIGTGIVPANFGSKSHSTDISFVLVATVRDTQSQIVADAVVTVAGVGGTVSRRSDRHGQVRLPLMIQSGEFLRIAVETGKQRYQSYQQISPAGAREVEQSLFIERSGTVRVE